MKKKFYVVWSGLTPGIYHSWDECQAQIKGVKGAVYKSFDSKEEAERAYASPAYEYVKRTHPNPPQQVAPSNSPKGENSNSAKPASSPLGGPTRYDSVGCDEGRFISPEESRLRASGGPALAVDAACSGNPGPMEYRGVYLGDGKEIFHFGPVHGTNNIGEFLAIVHALALLDKQGLKMTIYSDSRTAIGWVRKKCCKTQLERNETTEQLFQLIERAEAWLKSHRVTNPIVKWETDQWGEIPADFGRK
ncbi:MAG: ribonuclease H family protein [Bacteroidaceae bacterium]|nr:ribonuclease H family protein [Bacteroidaceae bacterium]